MLVSTGAEAGGVVGAPLSAHALINATIIIIATNKATLFFMFLPPRVL
ncbi:MAG TPA: hypothetical protein PKW29_07840 [Clostridia bacterium]|jgi:hypothetical protein|nr:hypothetical protein [Clostridia bacterium]